MRVRVFSTPSKLAESAAAEIAAWLRVDADRPTVGLAGGSTPQATYRALGVLEAPWNRVDVWMTDERFVPPGGPDHNATMARAALLDHVGAVFHEVPYRAGDPESCAAEYEARLREVLPDAGRGPVPGLVILGLGADGHTASLFAGSQLLAGTRRGYEATWVAALGSWRLTATLPLLAAARRTMFIVSGVSKAAAVARVLDPAAGDPAALVSRASRDPVWLLDREAASALDL
jgi:6-phosphogluconolactonase